MSYQAFLERMGMVNDLLCSSSILVWDSRTMMPPGAVAARGQQIATLTMLARNLLVEDETRRLLDRADAETRDLPEDSAERRALSQTRAAVDLHRRIPADLQQERAGMRAVAQAAWIEARQESRFDLFAPYLAKTVEHTRRLADAIGWSEHPYDAMLSLYEPGETVASLKQIFAELRGTLVPLVRAIAARPEIDDSFLHRDYPEDRQRAFALTIAESFGYDMSRGRLDSTVHPFEISFTRDDVRITTRYRRDFLPASLFGTLHETGHGLYEQGVDPRYSRTPLATDMPGLYAVGGVSFGAHESQSRLWENHIGRSRRFWALHYEALQETFPEQLGDIEEEAFYRAINKVRPGLIRVEADELTYDLHIMMRTEIESDLTDGSLKVADLPEAWNALMTQDLGVTVPNDRLGVLQDIHWSSGTIGTFCNYTIGNIMAAQLVDKALDEEPEIAADLEAGRYLSLRQWLGDAIHQHGRRFSRDELLLKATGRTLETGPYLRYLEDKYAGLYGLGPVGARH
jgi:carboxypeptidase Taq